MPADYGHSTGGLLSVVKKSGTNDFHGTASDYGRTRNMTHVEHRAQYVHAATVNFSPSTNAVNFKNPQLFGKLTGDQVTASIGGEPIMNYHAST